jgi:hypothetical protein
MIENEINQIQKIIIHNGIGIEKKFFFYFNKKIFSRTNSGANSSTTTTNISHVSSPKNPMLHQQSPNILSSTKTPLSSGLSTSVPPHFTYPTSTTTTNQPVLQYSTIVSQNTLPSTSTTITSSNLTSKQQNILSPQTKQTSRQTSISSNDSTVNTTSTQSISSVTITTTNSTSHPPSLLSNTDRTGIDFYLYYLIIY